MINIFKGLTRTIATFVKNNSREILTGVSIGSSFLSIILASKAALSAVDDIRDARQKKVLSTGDDLTTFEKVKIIAPHYIPTALSFATTTAATVANYKESTNMLNAFIAASNAAQTTVTEIKDTIVEKMGERKAESINNSIVEKHFKEISEQKGVNINDFIDAGMYPTYDAFSKTIFKCNVAIIERAQKEIVQALSERHDSWDTYSTQVTLNDFRRKLNVNELEDLPAGYSIGWDETHPIDVEIDTIMINDTPCIHIKYQVYDLNSGKPMCAIF